MISIIVSGKEEVKIKNWFFYFIIACLVAVSSGCSGIYVAKLELISPEPTDGSSYRDENLEISFSSYITSSIDFRLKNTGHEELKILWGDARIFDPEGFVFTVVVPEEEEIAPDIRMSPTILKPGEVVEDRIIPWDNLYYNIRAEQWTAFNIVPTEQDDIFYVRSFQGEIISLLLPVDIGGEVHEYKFNFKIDLSLFRWAD